jgi:hypothetical protein
MISPVKISVISCATTGDAVCEALSEVLYGSKVINNAATKIREMCMTFLFIKKNTESVVLPDFFAVAITWK